MAQKLSCFYFETYTQGSVVESIQHTAYWLLNKEMAETVGNKKEEGVVK